MKLYRSCTAEELKVGDEVTTFRGEKGILTGMREPHKSSSTGRVYVRINGVDCEFFPPVVGAEFREEK